jgi:hypothetical protein
MFIITRDYLLIPGIEVNIKRLFNIIRDILRLRRILMSIKTIRALILIKDFLYY